MIDTNNKRPGCWPGFLLFVSIFLAFDRISGLVPGRVSAQNWVDIGETKIDQGLCRTGTRFFRRSGTVGDDPIFFVQLARALLDFASRDIQRAGDVTGLVRCRIAHIQEHGGILVKRRF